MEGGMVNVGDAAGTRNTRTSSAFNVTAVFTGVAELIMIPRALAGLWGAGPWIVELV